MTIFIHLRVKFNAFIFVNFDYFLQLFLNKKFKLLVAPY